jgi:hypothetical protein
MSQPTDNKPGDLPGFRSNANGAFRLGRSVENANEVLSESDKVGEPLGGLPGSGKSLVGGLSESDKESRSLWSHGSYEQFWQRVEAARKATGRWDDKGNKV